ncbi:class I SAM-dependent methyltransferase [Azospirillum cavernae]|nr:class I SAM-dependent methyltransferase [Azospirillum cavernae]
MPLHTVRRFGAGGGGDRYVELRLVACAGCGHLYNEAFDSELGAEMYGDGPLTNVPVHPSMTDRLRQLIVWLDVEAVNRAAPPDIIEIGSGSGHLARILAPLSRSITVFEPNRSLTAAMLPEPAIRLVSEELPPVGLPESADLVICRQVLEHLADPLVLLRAIRSCLREGGRAYLEVPNGGYVFEHAAFMDVHLPHVQYFSRDGFLHLARRAGLAPVKEQWIKGRHDFGILFTAVAPEPCPPSPPPGGDAVDLGQRFTARIAAARDRLSQLGPRIGLYGATAQAQSFVNAMAPSRRFPVVFDDTPGLSGFALFDRHHDIPVEAPSAERLATLDAVVVTAYLHDSAIARNLRAGGFAGPILTIRADFPTDEPDVDWLYTDSAAGPPGRSEVAADA